jgi:hypothetical protein
MNIKHSGLAPCAPCHAPDRHILLPIRNDPPQACIHRKHRLFGKLQGKLDQGVTLEDVAFHNVRPLRIETPVIFPDSIQLVSEQTVTTSGDQAAKLFQFMDRRHHRTNPGALQVGKEVLDLLFAPLVDQSISIRGWPALPMKTSNVLDARGDLIDGDCSVYAHGISSKDSYGSCNVRRRRKQRRGTVLPMPRPKKLRGYV